jgi:SAM-dependent methyltransferase
VGEEQDAHGGSERERLARVYETYRRDPRKRRAWSAANAGNVAMREEVLDALCAIVPDVLAGEGTLLDAGCGGGWWLAALARRGVAPARLVGVELRDERVRAARELVPGARVIEGDLRALPLADDRATLVLLFTVLSAMGSREDVRLALAEVRRVLARGGAVAIWEPRVPTANRHTRLIRVDELRRALGGELTVRTITLAPPLARRAGGAYAALARIPPLRTHRLVIARP